MTGVVLAKVAALSAVPASSVPVWLPRYVHRAPRSVSVLVQVVREVVKMHRFEAIVS